MVKRWGYNKVHRIITQRVYHITQNIRGGYALPFGKFCYRKTSYIPIPISKIRAAYGGRFARLFCLSYGGLRPSIGLFRSLHSQTSPIFGVCGFATLHPKGVLRIPRRMLSIITITFELPDVLYPICLKMKGD